jgi:hypothetical protein
MSYSNKINKALAKTNIVGEDILVLDSSHEKIAHHKGRCTQYAEHALKISKEIRSLLSDTYVSDLILDEHNQNLLSRAKALLETIHNLRSTFVDAVNDKGGLKTVDKIPKFTL